MTYKQVAEIVTSCRNEVLTDPYGNEQIVYLPESGDRILLFEYGGLYIVTLNPDEQESNIGEGFTDLKDAFVRIAKLIKKK